MQHQRDSPERVRPHPLRPARYLPESVYSRQGTRCVAAKRFTRLNSVPLKLVIHWRPTPSLRKQSTECNDQERKLVPGCCQAHCIQSVRTPHMTSRALSQSGLPLQPVAAYTRGKSALACAFMISDNSDSRGIDLCWAGGGGGACSPGHGGRSASWPSISSKGLAAALEANKSKPSNRNHRSASNEHTIRATTLKLVWP